MNSHRNKIVICTPAIYSAGGVERVVAVKANYLTEQLGYEVTVIVTEGSGRDSFFPISPQVRIVNFELNFEELWRLSFWKKVIVYIQKQRQYKKRLTEELMRIGPDITISTLRREINFLTGIGDGSRKIGELHVNRSNYRSFDEKDSNAVKRLFGRFWMNSLIRQLKKLDRMVVMTETALHDWPELSNVVKIPDPLPFRIDSVSDLSQHRVISVGRYAYDKGNDLLLQVWAVVEKQMPDWSIDIYGNGNRDPYTDQVRQLGIDASRCHLYGPTPDVKKEYLDSSVFVLPSRFEGFGLVLIEAMACGVPVVSFDCENGPRSIITDGEDGFLVRPFDTGAFVEKVVLLMNDANLRKRMGGNARKTAAQYDIEIIGRQWKQLYDELMQGG